MKTSELTGAPLNWAVHVALHGSCAGHAEHEYSTDWAQGGPIIEREKIEVFVRDERWFAYSSRSTPEDFPGDTPLVAAMRCFVASRLGADVDVPKELV